LAPSDENVRDRKLTYFQTDIKNLHLVFEALKFAQDNAHVAGREYFSRAKGLLKRLGFLDAENLITEIGTSFITRAEELLTVDPALFDDDVNPRELEYLFHKLSAGAEGSAYGNIDRV